MREMRSITFDENEAIAALVDRIRRNREKLPSGSVSGLELLAEEPPVARLFITDDYGERHIIEKSGKDLTEALVQYCLDRRVRLPSGAAKFVEVVDGRASLFIYLDARDAVKSLMRRPQQRRAAAS
jgi:hypothetical protein